MALYLIFSKPIAINITFSNHKSITLPLSNFILFTLHHIALLKPDSYVGRGWSLRKKDEKFDLTQSLGLGGSCLEAVHVHLLPPSLDYKEGE